MGTAQCMPWETAIRHPHPPCQDGPMAQRLKLAAALLLNLHTGLPALVGLTRLVDWPTGLMISDDPPGGATPRDLICRV